MAKLFGVDQSHGNTRRIAGTLGYMAPESITEPPKSCLDALERRSSLPLKSPLAPAFSSMTTPIANDASRNWEGETSGAKDSNGNEIQIAPAELPTQTIQQVQPASSTHFLHESAPPQAGVTSENPFSVLEDLEEDTVHIDTHMGNINSASKDQLHARDNASLLEPGISRLDGQYTTCIEEEAKKDETAFIPALAQLYPPEPSDQFQGIAEHLQYELSTVKAPLLLTNGDTDPEEENDIEENQALVAYGSDSE
ncbi:hypothetical protein FRX31_009367, partial [Thalictrum thalictroides]